MNNIYILFARANKTRKIAIILASIFNEFFMGLKLLFDS